MNLSVVPLALHALDEGALIVAVRVWAEENRLARLDASPVYDPIDNGADVGYRPNFRYRVLKGSMSQAEMFRVFSVNYLKRLIGGEFLVVGFA